MSTAKRLTIFAAALAMLAAPTANAADRGPERVPFEVLWPAAYSECFGEQSVSWDWIDDDTALGTLHGFLRCYSRGLGTAAGNCTFSLVARNTKTLAVRTIQSSGAGFNTMESGWCEPVPLTFEPVAGEDEVLLARFQATIGREGANYLPTIFCPHANGPHTDCVNDIELQDRAGVTVRYR